tara:strand:- start:134 stop:436 length:303 start_codon:yes stop_codon:yes gene_type:complete
MTDLNCLKEKIELLSKFHQVEILKILKKDDICTLNENKNGIFINLTNIQKETITNLETYLEYVRKQEKQLNDIEKQKNVLSNTFFKDNKDNTAQLFNAES